MASEPRVGASSEQSSGISDGAHAWLRPAPAAGTVILYRDTWGVPHIHAGFEADGFYGLGYAIAQDNLEDTLRQHVIGRGETARHFGPAYLEIDRQFALFDVRAQAVAGLARLPSQLRQNAVAYVDGITRYLEDHPGECPLWAKEFRPAVVDLIGFSQLFTLMFPVNLMQGIGDCRRDGVDIPSVYDLFINLLRTGGPADASTAWAVAPWRTAVNGAIHLADPHNLIDVPSPEFRIHAGDFEFCGFMMGLLFTGHSRHVAWGTTFGSPDVADCYALKIESDDPNAYLLDGERLQIHRNVVRVAVQGSTPHTMTI